MRLEQAQDAFFDFLEEYADFLAQMAQDENEKLQALLSNHLPRIESAISTAQANAKQLENLEQRRIRLQEEAGFGGLSITELADYVTAEDRAWLHGLSHHIQTSLQLIQFHNRKSMNAARVNILLTTHNPEALEMGKEAVTGVYRKTGAASDERETGFLETKI